jgi:hypothetical protein
MGQERVLARRLLQNAWWLSVNQLPSEIRIQRTNNRPECKPDKWIVECDDPPHSTYHNDIDSALMMVKVMLENQT